MSKKNKGGKKMSQKTIATVANNNVKNTTAAAASPKAEEPKAEQNVNNTPKVNTTPKVAAKSTPKVDKPQQKKTDTKPVDKKPENKKPTVPTPPKTTPEVKVYKPEDSPTRQFLDAIMKDTKKTGELSPDSSVTLANLIQTRYINNAQESIEKYGKPFVDGMNTVVDALVVTTVIQQVVSTNTPFSLLIKNSAYPQIQSLAKTFNITLPSLEKLTLPGSSADTQLSLEFKPDDIPTEVKNQVKKENDAAKTVPMLDPNKMTGDEDVKKALDYLLSKRDNKNALANNLLACVKLVKDYRYAECNKPEFAKIKEERIKTLDSRNIDDWLEDLATFSEPTIVYKTLGYTMCKSIVNDKCPMGAFFTLRSIFTTKGECSFKDEEIALIVKTLVKWYTSFTKAAKKTTLEGKITDVIKKECEEEIAFCDEALHYLTQFDDSIVESIPDALKADSDAVTKKLYYITRSQYYGKDISGLKSPETEFENLIFNVTQRVGIVANLFRTISEQNTEYDETKISPLVKSESNEKSNTADNQSKTDDKEDTSKK